MKRNLIRPRFYLYWILILILSFLFCIDFSNNNPYDTQYNGSYSFTLGTIQDSVELAETVTVPFTQTGAHFQSLYCAIVDTSILNESYRNQSDSSIQLHFVKQHNGPVYLIGKELNNKLDTISFSIKVINPFYIAGPERVAIDESAQFSIQRKDHSAPCKTLQVRWNNAEPIPITISKSIKASTTQQISAEVIDEDGNPIPLDPVMLQVPGNRPIISSTKFTKQLTLGDTADCDLSFTRVENPYRVFISAKNNIFTDTTKVYTPSTSRQIHLLQELRDTGAIFFSVYIVDTLTRLQSMEMLISDTIHYVLPQVIVQDPIRTAPINREYTLSVGGTGTHYYWHSNSPKLDTTTESPSLPLNYTAPMIDTIFVTAIDKWGFKGPPVQIVLTCQDFKYSLEEVPSFPTVIQARKNEKFIVRMQENGNDIPDATYIWNVTPIGSSDTVIISNDTLSLKMNDSCQVTISVTGKTSTDSTPPLISSIMVTRNAPSIHFTTSSGLTTPSFSGEINDSLPVSVQITDPNASYVRTLYYQVLADAPDQSIHQLASSKTSFNLFFQNPDTFTIRAWCIDSSGFTSNIAEAQLFITANAPYFKPVTIDETVYINDPVTFTVSAFAGAKGTTITSYSWNRGSANLKSGNENFYQTTYSTPGTDTLTVRATSSRYDTTQTPCKISVTIKQGLPVVDSVNVDTNWVFIKTPDSIHVKAHDENGKIKKVEYDLDGNGSVDKTYLLDKATVDTSFAATYATAGSFKVKARLTDDDNLVSDWKESASITVDAGKPVLTYTGIDSAWVVDDTNGYRVHITDPNGTIKKVFASWNGGSAAQDSLTITKLTVPVDTFFKHSYDTSLSGVRTPKFWAVDNDTISSTVVSHDVKIKLGAPVLWGDTADTLWCVINNGAGFYNVHANASDPNGTITHYYWNDNQGWNTITTATYASYQFRNSDINKAILFTIGVRDNDSIYRANTFKVFADSAPPAPVIYAVPANDSTTIYWKNKDTKDGDSTKYRVLLHLESEPATSLQNDILSDWKTRYRNSDIPAYQYMFRFKLTPSVPAGSATYYYQVHARDARETISPSTTGHTFSY